MPVFEKHAQRINLWTALGQRAWSTAGAFGVQGWISTVILAMLLSFWGSVSYLVQRTPWWLTIFISIALSAASLRLYVEIRRALSVRGLKRIDLSEIGKDCAKFKDEVFEFLVNRADGAPSRREDLLPVGDLQAQSVAMHATWARGVDYSAQTRARAIQKFSHRAIYLNHVLTDAEITPVNLWAFEHNLPGIAAYFGALGELLERGLLKEARGLSPEGLRLNQFHLG